MRKNFPSIDSVNRDWVNIADITGIRREVLLELIDRNIKTEEILVEVHRRVGAYLPKPQAMEFIAQHIGEGQIRIANRDFTGYVVVAQNGVAASWSAEANPQLNRTRADDAHSG